MIDLENQEREIINLMLSQRISWLAPCVSGINYRLLK